MSLFMILGLGESVLVSSRSLPGVDQAEDHSPALETFPGNPYRSSEGDGYTPRSCSRLARRG